MGFLVTGGIPQKSSNGISGARAAHCVFVLFSQVKQVTDLCYACFTFARLQIFPFSHYQVLSVEYAGIPLTMACEIVVLAFFVLTGHNF